MNSKSFGSSKINLRIIIVEINLSEGQLVDPSFKMNYNPSINCSVLHYMITTPEELKRFSNKDVMFQQGLGQECPPRCLLVFLSSSFQRNLPYDSVACGTKSNYLPLTNCLYFLFELYCEYGFECIYLPFQFSGRNYVKGIIEQLYHHWRLERKITFFGFPTNGPSENETLRSSLEVIEHHLCSKDQELFPKETFRQLSTLFVKYSELPKCEIVMFEIPEFISISNAPISRKEGITFVELMAIPINRQQKLRFLNEGRDQGHEFQFIKPKEFSGKKVSLPKSISKRPILPYPAICSQEVSCSQKIIAHLSSCFLDSINSRSFELAGQCKTFRMAEELTVYEFDKCVNEFKSSIKEAFNFFEEISNIPLKPDSTFDLAKYEHSFNRFLGYSNRDYNIKMSQEIGKGKKSSTEFISIRSKSLNQFTPDSSSYLNIFDFPKEIPVQSQREKRKINRDPNLKSKGMLVSEPEIKEEKYLEKGASKKAQPNYQQRYRDSIREKAQRLEFDKILALEIFIVPEQNYNILGFISFKQEWICHAVNIQNSAHIYESPVNIARYLAQSKEKSWTEEKNFIIDNEMINSKLDEALSFLASGRFINGRSSLNSIIAKQIVYNQTRLISAPEKEIKDHLEALEKSVTVIAELNNVGPIRVGMVIMNFNEKGINITNKPEIKVMKICETMDNAAVKDLKESDNEAIFEEEN